MEVEKPFKCSTCSSRFTNEDHLQVHKKRHEMSLNLSKSGNNNAADGFVDETPTPTRFIRNCEEVGLFQDLQHVNPFDEQFKAASATPSSEAFEFNFSNSKKLPDDTLNTPQVFAFSTSNTVISHAAGGGSGQSPPIIAVINPTILPSASQENNSSSYERGNSDVQVGCTAEDSKLESITPDNEGHVPQLFAQRLIDERRGKSDCSDSEDGLLRSTQSDQNTSRSSSSRNSSVDEVLKSSCELGSYSTPSKRKKVDSDGRKKEMLERNRAAAHRSRERKKQWVSGLEGRCQTLQQLLSQVQIENAKLRQENNLLRSELSKHTNCEVVRADSRTRVGPKTPEFQPQILKHSSSSVRSASLQPTVVTVPAVASPPAALNNVSIVSSIKSKRGRPRKGFEKRFPTIVSWQAVPQPPTNAFNTPTGTTVISTDVEIVTTPVTQVQSANWIILKNSD